MEEYIKVYVEVKARHLIAEICRLETIKFTKDIYRFIKDNKNNRNYTLSKMFTNKYDIVEKMLK